VRSDCGFAGTTSEQILSPVLVLFLAGTGTALVTGLGAVPVWLLGAHAATLRPALWGLAAGVMGVASIIGLLIPALDEGGRAAVAAGLAAGVAFLLPRGGS
jgi:zinc transporter ZupT